MRARLAEFYALALSSFWFLPGVMMLGGVLLFCVTLAVDRSGAAGPATARLFYSGGTENAVNLLQTVTGAMVAIATVVFSTLMLVLTLATSQFGHRLIRSFMRDRANQAVLGIFLSTFVYCMLVFHMVGNDPGNSFVPGVSITVGFVLALFASCTLIYFTHHMAQLIAAPRVLAAVGKELDDAIDRVYPDAEEADATPPSAFEADDGTDEIHADSGGYVQAVGIESLAEMARKHDVVFESAVGYGDYVLPGVTLVRTRGNTLDEQAKSHARSEYVLGEERVVDCDLLFATNQVAEIAVRALSPALNDPFTAVDCINRLGLALARLAARPLPDQTHLDSEGAARFTLRVPGFDALLDAAYNPIRNYGRGSLMTTREMLRVITKLAVAVRREPERAALRRHAEVIRAAAEHGLGERSDIERIERYYQQAIAALRDSQVATPQEPSADG